jgi:transposase
VGYNFRPVDRTQQFMLPVSMVDWLPQDHFARFVVELVDALDTSPFLAAYRADGRGGTAYDPTMMATLLMYAYCDGERSSRRIEEHCRTDIAYRYIAGGVTPDHSTIARFRDRHETELAELFVPVLGICLQAGAADTSFAAIDGTKLRCPASLRARRKLASIEAELATLTEETETELARIVAEILLASRRADLEDDQLPGMPPTPPREPGTLPDLPGQLPQALHGKAARRAKLARAKQIMDDGWANQRADFDARLRARAEQVRVTGKGIRGPKPKPPVRDPDARINVTDPDCRTMKDAHNTYFAGYNGQNTVSGDWTVLTSTVVNDENDTAQLHPMMNTTRDSLTAAGSTDSVGVYAADSGYRTADAIAALDPDGPTVLLATGKEHETRQRAAAPPACDGPPPADASPAERIDWHLETAWGKKTYARRAATVEPRFGQIKHNRGINRFLRVGLTAVDSEWKLINLTGNIMRLYRRTLAGTAHPTWSTLPHITQPTPQPA